MQRKYILLIVLIGVGCSQKNPPPAPTPVVPVTFQQILDAHNKVRSEHKLNPLKLNQKLLMCATTHSRDMAQRNFLSHTGSDRSNLIDRLKWVGYNYRTAGENIAMGQSTIDNVMISWMNSGGHRANILGNYGEFGGNMQQSADGTPYWVTVFGTPTN